ncbi:hypothetical protein DFH09DRAFT_1272801 [Mycena vulgaris]|nr:hypothetical protein DFH09DRAFT_1272801 [Mycena vulgaris]
MGTHSRARKTRAANLLLNLTNIGTKTKRAWEELSPKKLQKWFSPRKKHKENTVTSDASDTPIHVFDASDDASDDPFTVSSPSFPIPGFAPESPSAAPASRIFTWKLLKSTVEEVEDDDDSTYTFCPPAEPRPFIPTCSPTSGSENLSDDPLDLIDVPEHEDELLATPPSHDDEYPRPCASRTFLDHMHKHGTRAGACRQAPNLGEAKTALECLQRYLRGELRGTDLWGRRGVRYKDPDISAFTRNRLIGMQTLLNFYVTPVEGGTYAHWGASARLAAHGLGRGKHCAHVLAALARQFIHTREVLDVNPYGEWNDSMLADEDLANDIRLYLQSLGKEITADKLVEYLNSPEHIDIWMSWDTERAICRWTQAPRCCLLSRQHLSPTVIRPPPPRPRRETWYHKDAPATPYRKGEGHSFRVADYSSSDFGWLRDPDNPTRNARRCMRPGKGRDGYFTSVEVLEQAAAARALVKELWPEFDHVFVYDNATTHKKRPEGSLSARAMPKGPSGTRTDHESAC